MPDARFRDGIVVVGASLAGLRAAETLRSLGYDGPLTVVGEEPHHPYDRPPLSKQVLTGRTDAEGVALPGAVGLDVRWMTSTAASGLDPAGRRLRLADGSDLPFGGLVIATGARPRVLPWAPPGPGVHYLRTLDDALALRRDLLDSRALAVIGAGFIGLEVASSATSLGVATVVLEALPVPLERALGPELGRAVMAWHRSKGLDLRVGVSVTGLALGGDGRPEGIRLRDATVVPADTVVVGIGVEPATGWLADSGLDLADGVVCDEYLRVLAGGRPRPDIVAAGDVARWWHRSYGEAVRVEHWTHAVESGEAAARTLLGQAGPVPVAGDGPAAPADPVAYEPVPYFWSDQHGVKLQVVGRISPGDDVQLLEGSFEEDRLLMAFGKAGRLVAGFGLRRPAKVMALQRMIAAGSPFPTEV